MVVLLQIPDGICLLSDKAARDVGGLHSDGQSEAHHFEMIPMMGGCSVTELESVCNAALIKHEHERE